SFIAGSELPCDANSHSPRLNVDAADRLIGAQSTSYHAPPIRQVVRKQIEGPGPVVYSRMRVHLRIARELLPWRNGWRRGSENADTLANIVDGRTYETGELPSQRKLLLDRYVARKATAIGQPIACNPVGHARRTEAFGKLGLVPVGPCRPCETCPRPRLDGDLETLASGPTGVGVITRPTDGLQEK